uniref:Choline transporter-like protein n=1 Tax=Culicoides sonorensis TaxID=179676 RepID=A0A336MF94_CULSO
MGGCFSSDSENKKVPLQVKGCTDTFWLVVFILFALGMAVIAVFSFVYGNPLRLINGYDSFGNTCGVKNNIKYNNFPLSGRDTSEEKYLFFLDAGELTQSLKICVKRCPKQTLNTTQDLYDYYKSHIHKGVEYSGHRYCRYDFNYELLASSSRNTYTSSLGPCAVLPVYKGRSILNRCVPTESAGIAKVQQFYQLLNNLDLVKQILQDFYKSWHYILGISSSAVIFSVILICLMHCLTQIVSWIICIFVAIASIVITVVLWKAYFDVKSTVDALKDANYLETILKNETAIFVLAIVATVVMITILILVFIIKDKIKGLAALFEEAGKCMLQLPGLVCPPFWAFICLLLYIAFWMTVVICLASANYPFQKPIVPLEEAKTSTFSNMTDLVPQNQTADDYRSLFKVEYVESRVLKYMTIYYLVALIWVSEFIFACSQMAIAGAVAYWYFKIPTDSPVSKASCKLVKFHLGSVAKGSLLITLFKIPRLILTYLYAKMKAKKGESGCAECGLKCCICCFYLLEKFIRYLNHNAYTVIAIESLNFCPAAGVAWNSMASNALQVATINGIGDFILFLGKLAVAAVCGIIAILVLKNQEEIQQYIIVAVFISLVAFFIAHIILSLYEMVVDTLFLCVCEDKNINGLSGRWKESNLAHLLGEEPARNGESADQVEAPMQQVEMAPITSQPFHHVDETPAQKLPFHHYPTDE